MERVRPEALGFSPERLARIQPVMRRYVEEGKFAGILTMITRRGKLAHFEQFGMQDLETGKPMSADAIFRIYSMTKPITSVAALMLMEEGRFRLDDPVSAYIPELKDLKVLVRAGRPDEVLEDSQRQINIRDLFTHTAGFSYGFDDNDPLDRRYQKEMWGRLDNTPGATLKDMVAALGKLPLAHQPGTNFRYSVAIDVLGYLVEVISGTQLDNFFQERIFKPLGMVDTAFWVAPEKIGRFANNYGPDEAHPGKLKNIDPLEKSEYVRPKTFLSGGGGLVSTADDYLRFCQMILNGGQMDGVRLLGRKTVELMRTNHLPAGVYEDANKSYGFGLGGNVCMHQDRAASLGSLGNWGWGGAATTKFWIDFKEELIGILMLQYMGPTIPPVIADYQNLVYQALVD